MNSALQLKLVKEFGIKELTSFQQNVFNVIRNTELDVLIHAGTGKGKTLSYLLPLVNQLYEGDSNLKVALIQPNTLLKTQINQVLSRLAPEYINNFHICTPRQLEKITEPIGTCVIDEADLSLSPACLPPKVKLAEYLRGQIVSKGRRVIYSGATFPLESSDKSINAQILKYNRNTQIIEEDSIKDLKERIAIQSGNEQFLKFKNESERFDHLKSILNQSQLVGKVIVFLRNKIEVAELLNNLKPTNDNLIITTDSMSRGIDIPDLQHVIHYYPPMSAIDYVHRVGRLNRLNSSIPKESCQSFCLLSDKDISEGPLYLKLLINARECRETITDISKFFSRNRSINKQIRRGKIALPS